MRVLRAHINDAIRDPRVGVLYGTSVVATIYALAAYHPVVRSRPLASYIILLLSVRDLRPSLLNTALLLSVQDLRPFTA